MLRKIWEGWKAIGRFIGNQVARIVLTLFYFTVFVPFGLGSRLFGDHLGIKSSPDRFWRDRETPEESIESSRRQG